MAYLIKVYYATVRRGMNPAKETQTYLDTQNYLFNKYSLILKFTQLSTKDLKILTQFFILVHLFLD